MTDGGFVRSSLSDLVQYEPGKPVEEVQRELGLKRVVKLASNEGPLGPFPAALDAMERAAPDRDPPAGPRRGTAGRAGSPRRCGRETRRSQG